MKLMKLFRQPVLFLRNQPNEAPRADALCASLSFIIIAVIFLLPFSIAKIVYAPEIYFSGKLNPFTLVNLDLKHILLAISIILLAVNLIRKPSPPKIGHPLIFGSLIIFLLLSELSIFFSSDQRLSFYLTIEWGIIIAWYLLLIQNYISLSCANIILIITSSLQSLLAIFQFWRQDASLFAPGIAKAHLFESILIRSYGTFSHPNILAAFLGLSIIITIYELLTRPKLKLYLTVALFLQTTALLFTISRSAIVALSIGIIILIILLKPKELLRNQKWISFIFIIFLPISIIFISQRFLGLSSQTEISERLMQAQIAFRIIQEHPLGVGLGNFTLQMKEYAPEFNLLPWNYQPVHNIILLASSELGIIAGLFLIVGTITMTVLLLKKILKSNLQIALPMKIALILLLIILVLSTNDHYFYSFLPAKLLLVYSLFFINQALCDEPK